MNKEPLVSVCLPVFRGEKFLEAAIESVLAQSYKNFELLISNDRSDDGSEAVIKRFADMDKRVRHWTNEKRLGLFENYNYCLREAHGEYLKPFAQDDLLGLHTLERMVAILETNDNVSLVSGGKRRIDEHGFELEQVIRFASDAVLPGKEVIIANLILLGNWIGEPSTVMFRRRDLGHAFDARYYHYGDVEFWFRLLEHGDLYYISDAVASFRKHAQSTTSANLNGGYFAADIFRLGNQYRKYLSELGEGEEHFSKRAAEIIARQWDHLVRNEGLTVEKVIDCNPRLSEQFSFDDVSCIRQALFAAERRVTSLTRELIETRNELEHRVNECRELNAATKQMQQSVSWRLTAPLRNVRSMMAGQRDE